MENVPVGIVRSGAALNGREWASKMVLGASRNGPILDWAMRARDCHWAANVLAVSWRPEATKGHSGNMS